MNLEEIYEPVKRDMEKVEERLAAIVASEVYPVSEIYNYVLSSGGKRVRPALVLLSAKSLKYNSPEVVDIACAVELIHMASLIHDDIVDSATLRRGMPAAHVVWSTEIAVTIGDYLFAQAMEILSTHENREVVKMFSRAIKLMTEGELLQAANRGNIRLTEEKYIRIVSGKTASLISASCGIVAKIADVSDSYHKALSGYGLNFGISYQITDDVLDLISTDNQLGKPARNSIREGDLTLPVIHTLSKGNGDLRKLLLSILSDEEADDMDLREIMDLIINSGALSYTQAIARRYAESGRKALAILKNSSAKQCLLSLADLIVSRHVFQGYGGSSPLAQGNRQLAEVEMQ